MKELYIIRGAYAGRVIQLEDSVATSALADNWALEMPEGGITSAPDGTDLSQVMYGEIPASLFEFEDAINRGGTSDNPESASGEPTPPPPDGGDGGDGGGGGDVAPVLSSLDPNTAALDSADVTMHVHGTGFTASSVIHFATNDEPTVFVSDTEVTTVVKPSLGWGEVAVPVTVKNGTQSSNALDFTFTAAAGA